jgi:cellulose biosynthesis protein BcsQ
VCFAQALNPRLAPSACLCRAALAGGADKMAPEQGRIFTFYSYKGGTGRSMALANFAWIMAASGKRVLAVDWDLEAPGLHRYFRPFLTDPDLFETDGLIDTFWSLASSLANKPPSENGAEVLDDDAESAIDDTKRRLNWKFPTGGYIDFVGAGRQGATYNERVNTFDWKRFYHLGGAEKLKAMKTQLKAGYDWVMIDSRTGVSDTAGICTMQLPDAVVACFTLNRQSIDGVRAVLGSIRNFRSPTVDGSAIKFFPLATRIENAEQIRLEIARKYARASILEFLPTKFSPKNPEANPREYWDKMELTYRPAHAFEETLAAFGDATGASGAADTMLSQVEAMAQCITGDDTLRMPEILETDRAGVLAKYAFGPSEDSKLKQVREPDRGAGDTDFLRGVLAKEQQWRDSKFFWRNLLSRRELDLLTDEDRLSFGRNMAYYYANSVRMHRLLRTINVTVFFVYLLLLSVAAGGYAAILTYSNRYDRDAYVLVAMPIAIGFAWPIIGSLGSALVYLFGDRPYGFRLWQVFPLVMGGPLLSAEMPDYEAAEQRDVRRTASSRKQT